MLRQGLRRVGVHGVRSERIMSRTVVKVTKHSDATKVATMRQLNEDVFKFHSQGHYTQASYAADLAIQKARDMFGQDHISLASAYANRGFIAKELGEFNDAVDLYELALKVYDKQPNQQHGRTVVLQNLGNALRNLSNTHRDPKKQMELRYRAKTVLEDALSSIKESDGIKSLKYASAAQKLGNLNKDMNNLEVAEQLLREAVATASELDGTSPILFSAKNDLGLILKIKKSSFEEARQLYEEAIEFASKRFGEDHKETIVYKHNLAELLQTRPETDQEATRLRLSILMTDSKRS